MVRRVGLQTEVSEESTASMFRIEDMLSNEQATQQAQFLHSWITKAIPSVPCIQTTRHTAASEKLPHNHGVSISKIAHQYPCYTAQCSP
jgi:hypothetical protein